MTAGGFRRVDLRDPTDAEIEALGAELSLPNHVVEELTRQHQRPKVEFPDGGVLVVLKTAEYVDHDEVVTIGELSLFATDSLLIVIERGGMSRRGTAGGKSSGSAVAGRGQSNDPVDALVAITAAVVDSYAAVVDGIEVDLDQVETTVFSPVTNSVTERIYYLKRELLQFQRACAPLLDALQRLVGSEYMARFLPARRARLHDTINNLQRTIELVYLQRDLLSSVLESNLTMVGLRQNEDMRRLAAWAALIGVPTMIAGVYGMNFEHMPELHWTGGYPAVLAAMALICAVLYGLFRRSHWL